MPRDTYASDRGRSARQVYTQGSNIAIWLQAAAQSYAPIIWADIRFFVLNDIMSGILSPDLR